MRTSGLGSAFSACLLGVRGSTPAPGQPFVRYGGHTSCVAISVGGRQPSLVLDAGTGIRNLELVLGKPFDGTVVLSHLHWDHIHGLPFSPALLDPQARVSMKVPVEHGVDALEALRPGFSPPNFPVQVDALSSGWSFTRVEASLPLIDCVVRTTQIRHKGGVTVGIRVEYGGRSLVYMPDHDLAERDADAEELARGADVLLHDAQYLDSELEYYRDFGHSTVEQATSFADDVEVGHLVLTHHAPTRTDTQLDIISANYDRTPEGRPVTVAREGTVVSIDSVHRPRQ